MNPRLKELLTQAGVSDNWNTSDWYSMSPAMVEKFAELVKQDNTQEVVRLCANTINNNLNKRDREHKNKIEIIEMVVIVIAVIAWGSWWYSQLH